MTKTRVRRKDGTFFDAAPGYTLQDGEAFSRPFGFMDGVAGQTKLTDERVLDLVRDEMRPKDTSRLSAAQLRRAFVALKLGAEDMLSKSDSFIEGAFKALTADLEARHIITNPDMVEQKPDGTIRDAASGARDMANALRDHAYDEMRSYISTAWRGATEGSC